MYYYFFKYVLYYFYFGKDDNYIFFKVYYEKLEVIILINVGLLVLKEYKVFFFDVISVFSNKGKIVVFNFIE